MSGTCCCLDVDRLYAWVLSDSSEWNFGASLHPLISQSSKRKQHPVYPLYGPLRRCTAFFLRKQTTKKKYTSSTYYTYSVRCFFHPPHKKKKKNTQHPPPAPSHPLPRSLCFFKRKATFAKTGSRMRPLNCFASEELVARRWKAQKRLGTAPFFIFF